MNEQVNEVMDTKGFQIEIERLIKYYGISASAKYTLTPRNDFVRAIVWATLEAYINHQTDLDEQMPESIADDGSIAV